MAENKLYRQLRAGIQAAQTGNKERARELLEAVLKVDRNNELAWIWMASVVDSTRERRICLQKVIQINPRNQLAQEALNSLVGVLGDKATLDYMAMSRVARTKLTAPDGTDARRTILDSGAPQRQSNVFLLLGIAAIILVIALAAVLIPTLSPVEETPTPAPSATVILETSTPRPTNTPPIAIETRDSPDTLPSETPTVTPTPSITPTPTSTLPPLSDYNVIFTAINRAGDTELYRIDGIDGEPRRLAGNIAGIDYDPTLNRLSFLREAEGDNEFLTTQVFFSGLTDPSDAAPITRISAGTVNSAAILPGGLRVIYSSNHTGNEELYIYDTSAAINEPIARSPNSSEIDPHMSQDGQLLAFASTQGRGAYDIFILNIADNFMEQITQTRGQNTQPRISPNKEHLLYINQLGLELNAYVVQVDGTRARELIRISGGNERSPVWTLDGRYIVLVSDFEGNAGQIYFLTLDGTITYTISVPSLDIQEVRVVR